MSTETYPAVRACSIALLGGAIIHAGGVTAGNGIVIDWRAVKSGEELQRDGDAFDTARLFVALVGPERALHAAERDVDIEPAPPEPRRSPRIHAYMANEYGARRRAFDAGPFRVIVEPSDESDEAQAAFTAMLAAFCAEVGT